jgi:hypothetical protein
MDRASELIFPAVNLPMRRHRNQMQVWDAFRKKWVKAGPEEWVRQHLAHYLCEILGYPTIRVLMEHKVQMGRHSRRFDLVVLGRDLTPMMLVECKAPAEKLDDEVWWQALCYNQHIAADFVVITNGLEMQIRMRSANGWQVVLGLPARAEWESDSLPGVSVRE